MVTPETGTASAPASGVWVDISPARPRARRRWARSKALLSLDAFALVAGVVAAEASSVGDVPRSPGWTTIFFPVLVLILLRARGGYRRRIRPELFDEIRTVVTATALATMAALSFRVLLADDPGAAGQTVRMSLFAASFLVVGRIAFMWSETRRRARGDASQPTLIIGAGVVGQRAAKRLLEMPHLGLRPIGYLDKDPRLDGNGALAVPVLGASWDLEQVVEEHAVEHAVIAFSTAPHDVLLRIARRCEDLGVTVSFVPRLFETMKEQMTIEHLGGLPLISREPTDPKSWQFAVKYAIDRVAAAFMIILLSPVLIAIAIAVRCSLGAPTLYHQVRIGRDGKEFEMLKFRSMSAESDLPIAELLKLPADTAPGGVEGLDRRTTVGQILRRTSLDELPQLLNVVRGDMSLVGPRPERPEYAAAFAREVHRYGERHRVRAGITGWAQVHGLRGKTSLADRAEWDNYYIDNWSLWLDFKILLLTLRSLVRFRAE